MGGLEVTDWGELAFFPSRPDEAAIQPEDFTSWQTQLATIFCPLRGNATPMAIGPDKVGSSNRAFHRAAVKGPAKKRAGADRLLTGELAVLDFLFADGVIH